MLLVTLELVNCQPIYRFGKGSTVHPDSIFSHKLIFSQEAINIHSSYAPQEGLEVLLKEILGILGWFGWFQAFL